MQRAATPSHRAPFFAAASGREDRRVVFAGLARFPAVFWFFLAPFDRDRSGAVSASLSTSSTVANLGSVSGSLLDVVRDTREVLLVLARGI